MGSNTGEWPSGSHSAEWLAGEQECFEQFSLVVQRLLEQVFYPRNSGERRVDVHRLQATADRPWIPQRWYGAIGPPAVLHCVGA